MLRIDFGIVFECCGSGYLWLFDVLCVQCICQCFGDVGGLCDFGVNLMCVLLGGWLLQCYWYFDEDEFVYVFVGEFVMIEDGGEIVLCVGDCVVFLKNLGNGYYLVNWLDVVVVYFEVGLCLLDDVIMCLDIDMMSLSCDGWFLYKDGMLYLDV